MINEDRTSCSLCAGTHPQYFRLDGDDPAETHNGGENVNNAAVAEADYPKVQESIDDCQGECIKWKD